MSNFRSFTRATVFAAAAAFAAAAVVPAGAAVTDPPKAQQDGAKPEAQPKKARKYCVETEGVGSRLARKVCKTRAEWIADDGFDPAGEK